MERSCTTVAQYRPICVAAVSARLTALDAVAENMGVSSQDIADKSKENNSFCEQFTINLQQIEIIFYKYCYNFYQKSLNFLGLFLVSDIFFPHIPNPHTTIYVRIIFLWFFLPILK